MEVLRPRSMFIREIAYNKDTKDLTFTFKGGRRYRYRGVSPQKFGRLKSADSKGSYFSNYIKGKYEMRRLKCQTA